MHVSIINNSLVIQVIVLTSLIMMFGLMLSSPAKEVDRVNAPVSTSPEAVTVDQEHSDSVPAETLPTEINPSETNA